MLLSAQKFAYMQSACLEICECRLQVLESMESVSASVREDELRHAISVQSRADASWQTVYKHLCSEGVIGV